MSDIYFWVLILVSFAGGVFAGYIVRSLDLYCTRCRAHLPMIEDEDMSDLEKNCSTCDRERGCDSKCLTCKRLHNADNWIIKEELKQPVKCEFYNQQRDGYVEVCLLKPIPGYKDTSTLYPTFSWGKCSRPSIPNHCAVIEFAQGTAKLLGASEYEKSM